MAQLSRPYQIALAALALFGARMVRRAARAQHVELDGGSRARRRRPPPARRETVRGGPGQARGGAHAGLPRRRPRRGRADARDQQSPRRGRDTRPARTPHRRGNLRTLPLRRTLRELPRAPSTATTRLQRPPPARRRGIRRRRTTSSVHGDGSSRRWSQHRCGTKFAPHAGDGRKRAETGQGRAGAVLEPEGLRRRGGAQGTAGGRARSSAGRSRCTTRAPSQVGVVRLDHHAIQVYQTHDPADREPKGQTTTLTGFTDAFSIEQAIGEARTCLSRTLDRV